MHTTRGPLWWAALISGLGLAAACAEATRGDSGAVRLRPEQVEVHWEPEGLRVRWRGPGVLRFGLAAHGNAPQAWSGEDCSGGEDAVCHEIHDEIFLRYGAAPGAVRPGETTAFAPSDAGGPPGHRTLDEHARGTSYLAELDGQCIRWSAGAQAYAPWDRCKDG